MSHSNLLSMSSFALLSLDKHLIEKLRHALLRMTRDKYRSGKREKILNTHIDNLKVWQHSSNVTLCCVVKWVTAVDRWIIHNWSKPIQLVCTDSILTNPYPYNPSNRLKLKNESSKSGICRLNWPNTGAMPRVSNLPPHFRENNRCGPKRTNLDTWMKCSKR